MNTSSSNCHTLAAEWAWLDILCLMHVLYVVYVAIGAPPPISLVHYFELEKLCLKDVATHAGGVSVYFAYAS